MTRLPGRSLIVDGRNLTFTLVIAECFFIEIIMTSSGSSIDNKFIWISPLRFLKNYEVVHLYDFYITY